MPQRGLILSGAICLYNANIYAFTCLFTIRVSVSPVSTSMNLVKSETLLSSLSAFHTSSVNSSRSFVSSESGVGSPSKLGSGSPSPMYVWMKCTSPASGTSYENVYLLHAAGFPLLLFRIDIS